MDPNPSEAGASELRSHLIIGALQAALAYALYASHAAQVWPASAPAVFVPLFALMVLAPLAFYLSSAAPLRRRLLIAAGAAALALAIGAYHGLTVSGLVQGSREARPFTEDDYLPPTLLLGLVFMVAVPAAAVAQGRRVPYEAWFDGLLHNSLLLLQAGLATGLFWVVMHSAAALFRLVHLPQLGDLIDRPEFWIPATALVLSYGVSLAVRHRGVAAFLFQRMTQLCGWLYPLAGALGVAFVASWLFQGIEPLLQTRRAAFLLLWFAVLSVLLVNASSRGGLDEPPYPRWLRRALSTGLLVLLPMVAVALYALGLRIQQYGWTVDRIWGLFVALVVALLALGYALNAVLEWAGRAERCLVPASNALAAAFVVLGVLLLIGGPLDPRRLSVNDQVQRLASGLSDQQDPIRYLARAGGVYGRQALEALAAEAPGAGAAQVARQRLARDALVNAQERRERQAALVQRLPVYPAGASAPPALLDMLVREGQLAACDAQTCLIWQLPDAIAGPGVYALLSRDAGQARSGGQLWSLHPKGQWSHRGVLPYQGLDAACERQPGAELLFDAVREGRVALVPRPAPDIAAGGLRFPVERWDGQPGC